MLPVDRDSFFQNQAAKNRLGDAVAYGDNVERRRWSRGSGIGNKSEGVSVKEEVCEYEEDDCEGCEEDERLVDGEDIARINLDVNHLQGKAINRDAYYAQVNCSEVSARGCMDLLVIENESGSPLRKEAPLRESVRSILSDPFTGELMDDAVIFPCGHSFGSGGLQQSLQKKACFTCSLPITEDSVQRNLSKKTYNKLYAGYFAFLSRNTLQLSGFDKLKYALSGHVAFLSRNLRILHYATSTQR